MYGWDRIVADMQTAPDKMKDFNSDWIEVWDWLMDLKGDTMTFILDVIRNSSWSLSGMCIAQERYLLSIVFVGLAVLSAVLYNCKTRCKKEK